MLLIFMFCGKILSSGKGGAALDRLDKTVAKQMNLSRSGARQLIRSGAVEVNGKKYSQPTNRSISIPTSLK